MEANTDLLARLQEFIESEARSCSMDPGCITPAYIYRMFGGKVAIEEIVEAFRVQGSWFMIDFSD